MKVRPYLFLLLILLSNSNLFAINTTSNIEETRVEKLRNTKKKGMTQRVLEKKIVKRIEKKSEKDKKANLGALSVMFSIIGLIFMFLSFKSIVVIGLLFGFIGLILGITAVRQEKTMGLIGIVFAALLFLISIGVVLISS